MLDHSIDILAYEELDSFAVTSKKMIKTIAVKACNGSLQLQNLSYVIPGAYEPPQEDYALFFIC